MPEVPITVSIFSPTKLRVDPPVAKALLDETPTLRWKPASNVTIQYIGFTTPVGKNQQIGIPREDSANQGQWIASDANTAANLFTYTVYAINENTGEVISSDPQIENEGTSGGANWDNP